MGNRPIAAIEAPELLEVLKRVEAKGISDTAHRTREVCGRVFRYAIATGRAKHDIAADLRGALAPRTTTNYAAITDPLKVGELLRAIEGYDGQPTTAAALKLAPTCSCVLGSCERPSGRSLSWMASNQSGGFRRSG